MPYSSRHSVVKASDLPLKITQIGEGVYRPIALRCEVIYIGVTIVVVEKSFLQDVRQPDYGGMRIKVISEALAKVRQRITRPAIVETCHA